MLGFMFGLSVRKLRKERKVCVTFCCLWFVSLKHLHCNPLSSQETNKKSCSTKGGSDVEMNLFHGCRKSQLCVVNALLSAGGKVTGSIQSAAPLAWRAGQDAHTHFPSLCAHEYTTGSQKVPGRVLLFCIGRTYGHAYGITLKWALALARLPSRHISLLLVYTSILWAIKKFPEWYCTVMVAHT
jgi:hypothetical protein